jgi:hypothetical protein
VELWRFRRRIDETLAVPWSAALGGRRRTFLCWVAAVDELMLTEGTGVFVTATEGGRNTLSKDKPGQQDGLISNAYSFVGGELASLYSASSTNLTSSLEFLWIDYLVRLSKAE